MQRALSAPIQTLLAATRVIRAAARVGWHEPRTALPGLVDELRRAPRARVHIDADIVEGVLERLLPVLPPFGAGRCVKRALTQLDLCARAGQKPRLHIGFQGSGDERHGHVWVSTEGAASPDGSVATWPA